MGLALRRHPAECPGVNLPGVFFCHFDDLHGFRFWSTGYGCTGEERLKYLCKRGLAGRRSCRGQLPDSRVFFQRTDGFGFNRSGRSNSTEVVAHHIKNHDVLGPVFGGLLQLNRLLPILCLCPPSRSGALHRSHRQMISLTLKEELG